DLVDLLGVLTNGILGGVVARQLRMDLVGFVVLAIVSGLGGGMLRDTLLQQGFPVALTNPAYLTSALAGALIAYLLVF
ncbi:trimeric intracellular cation channel family protein, partial [Xanthomonas citri pv. citri]|nr:trimeric intracellular cation channel family protein [Xanthomonas citri pv. citri]